MRLNRHCERSEAIHLAAWTEWIASSLSLLAMTAKSVTEPKSSRLADHCLPARRCLYDWRQIGCDHGGRSAVSWCRAVERVALQRFAANRANEFFHVLRRK